MLCVVPASKVKPLLKAVAGGRPVAQLAEQRSPKPQVGGSIPSWPANTLPGIDSGADEYKR
jgi:hypothetical protein